MSTVTMYDAVEPAAWPKDAKYLACYVDGKYANYVAGLATGAKIVSITVFGADADVGDVEVGCIWPNSKGAAWAGAQLRRGRRPTLYTFAANWGDLSHECLKAGIVASAVDWWVAQWDEVATVPAGAVAKQYHSGATLDISVALASWGALGGPAPVPATLGGDDVFIVEPDGSVRQLVYGGTGTYWRPLPAHQAAMLPPEWLLKDDGTWLSLWHDGAP